MKHSKTKAFIALAGGIAVFSAVAYAATTLILAVGTIPESEFFGGSAKVTVRTLTIQPGETLAWHHHPGYAFNVVKSGTLTVENGCGGEETITSGQAFEEVEGEVHRGKNLGSVPVVVYNTFVIPDENPTTVNTPNNERLCGPPAVADDCKNDAWMQYSFPQTFADQGECVKWALHRPRVTVPLPPL